MKFGLNEDSLQLIFSVFRKFPEVEEVIIYGSRAKGNYKEGSDIDLTLKGRFVNEDIKSRIYQELEDLPTPYLFDVSLFKTIESESLLDHICRIGTVFYQKKVDQNQ